MLAIAQDIISRNRKVVVAMTVDDFIALPEHVGKNTAQRNTELRAEKALKGHLSKIGINHDEVRVAVRPDGVKFRVDGNTRAWLWERNLLERPAMLHVTETYCSTMEDFDEAYNQVDNLGQTKSKDDLAYGVMRANGFTPTSPLLQAPKLSVALWVAMESKQVKGGSKYPHKFDEHAALIEWLPELRLLDSLGIKGNAWGSGIIGGALIALRLHKNKNQADILEFFRRYQKNQGESRPNTERPTVDAVYALRKQKATGSGGWDKAERQAGRVLSAVSLWLKRTYIFNNSEDTPKLDAVNIQGVTRLVK